jgi:hypothetical protein
VAAHKDAACSVETSQREHSSRQREIPPLGNLEQSRRDPLVFVTSGEAGGGALSHSQISVPTLAAPAFLSLLFTQMPSMGVLGSLHSPGPTLETFWAGQEDRSVVYSVERFSAHLENSWLLHDTEPQMRHALWRLHHARALQLDGLCAKMFEQPRACAEQYGHEVDLDLVE